MIFLELDIIGGMVYNRQTTFIRVSCIKVMSRSVLKFIGMASIFCALEYV
jgi:hypothetical protein